MRVKQCTKRLEAMQTTDSPRRSRDINDVYANLNGKHLVNPSSIISMLSRNGYITPVHISVKEDPKKAGVWYVLTDAGRVPGIIPVISHKKKVKISDDIHPHGDESSVVALSKNINNKEAIKEKKWKEFLEKNPDIYRNEQEFKRERGVQKLSQPSLLKTLTKVLNTKIF